MMLHAVLLTLAMGLASAPAGAQPSPPRHPDWATPLPQIVWKNIERYLSRVNLDELRARIEAPQP